MSIKKQFFRLSVLIVIMLLIPNDFIQIGFALLICIYCYWIEKRLISVFLLLFYLLIRINITPDIPITFQGKILEIKDNYCVVLVENQKVIIYNLENPKYDSTISFVGEYQKIHSVAGFFSFQFEQWANYQGMYYQIWVTDSDVIKEGNSIKSFFYQRIQSIENGEIQGFLNSVIFSISNNAEDTQLNELIIGSGMHLTAMVYLMQSLLSLFLYPKKAKRISYFCFFLYGYLFGYHFVLLRYFLRIGLEKIELSQKDRFGLYVIILLCVNPNYLFQIKFIIPILFQFLRLFQKKKTKLMGSFVMIPVQLATFYQCNILSVFFFPIIRWLSFICYWSAIGSVLFSNYELIEILMKGLSWISYPSIIITGKLNLILIVIWFFFISNYLLIQRKVYLFYCVIILLVNQHQSIFYPWGEVTQLYVGQGDCTIIRVPFSNQVILIDTGPPTGYSYIEQYLNGLGIKEIAGIFITHDDLDHSGSLESIQDNFIVHSVIKEKTTVVTLQGIEFQILLHDREYLDKNDNSLILYAKINQLNYLFLGDIGKEVEGELVKEYPTLEVDVIKLAHHGSKTSSSFNLFDSYSIKLGLISSGYRNRYNHPSREVVNRLSLLFIPYLNTAEVGDIQIRFFSFYNLLLTSRLQFVIIE